METRDIIAKAATTGKAEHAIGIITCNTTRFRATWKLNGKQIAFKKLIDRLNN